MAQKRKSAFQISYVTITYRSVFLSIFCVAAMVAVVLYFAFPERSGRVIDAGERYLQKALVKIGLASANASELSADTGPQQAHFTNIDGTVRVKKASSNMWISANYNVALERGDVVQTSEEGIAKVVFADGTNYTVKPDSLIVIQDNSVNSNQQTSVAVQVTTGTVDLATSTLSRGSRSQVIVAGATATIAGESSAQVVNDPRADEHAITVTKGSGEVTRDGQTVQLASWDKASFKSDQKGLTKTKEIGPPVLLEPRNESTVAVGAGAPPVTFSWAPVDNAKGYHIRLSTTPYFTGQLVYEKTITVTQIALENLGQGTYFWDVRSIGPDDKESADSEHNRFSGIPQGSADLLLELEPSIQHGHVIEVRGRTEPGARVMVNGQPVALVKGDGTFSHFTSPLPSGENIITVTAQNAKGGVNTKQEHVTIQ